MTNIGVCRDEHILAIDERISEMEKCLPIKIDVDFIWKIDRLAERKNYIGIWSEYFNVRNERYKMRLSCGWRWNNGENVIIYLDIHPGQCDGVLQWPFERRVTITITNRHIPNMHKTITKQCRIARPPNSSYRNSDPFIFSYLDLSNTKLMLGNKMVVNCVIDNQ